MVGLSSDSSLIHPSKTHGIGYNKDAPPPACSGYVGPQELGGAINAPTDSGSYMGYQFFPFSQSQGYDPQTCADACDAQTLYDSQHPAADGSFMSCVRHQRSLNKIRSCTDLLSGVLQRLRSF